MLGVERTNVVEVGLGRWVGEFSVIMDESALGLIFQRIRVRTVVAAASRVSGVVCVRKMVNVMPCGLFRGLRSFGLPG